MSDPYQAKIDKCKQPKQWSKVKYLLQYLILGIRNKYDTATMVQKLNARGIKPLVSDRFNMNSLQMQIMFMARLDETSTLGRGFAYMLKTGEATAADMALLQDRVR